MTKEIPFDFLAGRMRVNAFKGVWHGGSRGLVDQAYFARCRKIQHGTTMIFTRDVGHHTSGWFKNPDYERCLHLSMSAQPGLIWTPDTPDFDERMRNAWLRAFFKEDLDKVWFEPPVSPEGRSAGVQHWRLFCDATWKPIVPRGEVYETEFTEKGWKTSSEMRALEQEIVSG